MKFVHLVAVIAICAGISPCAWPYDAELAKSYAAQFASVEGPTAGQALHLMSSEAFIKRVQAGEELMVVDVRTPAETAVFGMTLPGSLAIPASRLFEPDNLDRIPADTTVVILCQSGTRSVAVGTALRHLGFDNVFVLKGGFRALSDYLDPVTAHP